MRPIKLTMNAFGPFAKMQTIDFTRLEGHPIFLINGATGAGKTTILDAICYSLYDQISGEDSNRDRDAKQMRSHYAPSEEETFVEFEFSVDNTTYYIKRSPEQEIPKKRGEGSTKKPTEAILKKKSENGDFVTIATKSKEVTSSIEEIIGLKGDQFRQIIVLPQGKFRKLLQSDSKEKQEILKTLFATEVYRRTEEVLKNKSTELKKGLESKLELIEHLLSSLNVDSIKSLDDAIDSKTSEREEKRKEFQGISDSLKQKRQQEARAKEDMAKLQELDDAKVQVSLLEAKKEEFDEKKNSLSRLQKALEFSDKIALFEKYQKDFNEEKEKALQCEENLKIAVKEEAEASGRLEELSSLDYDAMRKNADSNLERLVRLKEELESFIEKKANMVTSQEIFGKINSKYQELKKGLDADKERAKGFSLEIDLLKSKQHNIDGSLGELEKLREDISKIKRAKDLLLQIENLDREFTVHLESAKTIKEQLSILEENARSYQIAQLKSSLIPGEPCPVCGALDHPSESTINLEYDIDFKKIDSLKQENSEKEAILNEIKMDINLKNGQLSELTKGIDTTVEEHLKGLMQKESELLARMEIERESSKRMSDLQTDLLKLTERTKVEEKEIATLFEELTNAKERYIADKAVYDLTVSEELKNLSEDSLNFEIEEARSYSLRLTKEYEIAQKALDKAKGETRIESIKLENANNAMNKAHKNFLESQRDLNEGADRAGYSSVEELLNIVKDLPRMNQLSEEVSDYELKLYEANIRHDRAKNACEGIVAPMIDIIQSELYELERNYEERSKELSKVESDLLRMKEIRLKIDETTSTSGELEKEYKVVAKLNEIANGKNQFGLTFERFVLGSLLDEVLDVASKRFSNMSNGRYSLERTMKRLRRDAAGGLEIDVIDSYTGKSRSVSTLSGGESFKASLAMALALADVMQSKSGGIHLDTIFIDEGFGSLDQESLDASIKVLTSINALGRMVGIISHVPELKERITSRIDVEPDFVGSKATIVIG